MASPPVGVGPGQLSLEESVMLLARTFPRDEAGLDLTIVVEKDHERETAEAVLRSRR